MTHRYVVLGVASHDASWLDTVAGWGRDGSLAIEVVKCTSVEEVRARLATTRPYSALLFDVHLAGLDMHLVAVAAAAGCATVAVGGPGPGATWLDTPFGADDLGSTLHMVASPITRPDITGSGATEPRAGDGRLVAVTGPGGTGTTTVAMGLAASAGRVQRTLLADFQRVAELSYLHHEGGYPDLLDLCHVFSSGRRLQPADVRGHTWPTTLGYDALWGLPRSRAWAAITPSGFGGTLDGLRCAYQTVVGDVDADLEGEEDCGSFEVEERNVIARTVIACADVVVAVGRTGYKGRHSLATVIESLLAFGVPRARIVPVINQVPDDFDERDRISEAFVGAFPDWIALDLAGPAFVPPCDVEAALRDGDPLPDVFDGVVSAVRVAGLRAEEDERRPDSPTRVAPGELGTWGPD